MLHRFEFVCTDSSMALRVERPDGSLFVAFNQDCRRAAALPLDAINTLRRPLQHGRRVLGPPASAAEVALAGAPPAKLGGPFQQSRTITLA